MLLSACINDQLFKENFTVVLSLDIVFVDVIKHIAIFNGGCYLQGNEHVMILNGGRYDDTIEAVVTFNGIENVVILNGGHCDF